MSCLLYTSGTYAWNFLDSRVFITIVLLLIPVLVSGGIHLDGLLDTSDALNSYQPREKKLEILKDSNAGAFAIIAVSYTHLDVYKRQV